MRSSALSDADIAIIGGGILGCSVAYYLAKGGADVAVIERGELNREASGVNAGSLHFQVYMHANHDPEWIHRIRPSIELHRQAAVGWRTLESELGADLGVRIGGGLMVAETTEEMAVLREKVRVENSMGLETRLLDAPEVLQIAPYLSDHVLGAAYCDTEGFANPLLVGQALARASKSGGARLYPYTEATSISPRAGGGFVVGTNRGTIRAGRVIDAAGSWAGEVARLVGLDLPIRGTSIHMNVTEPLPPLMGGQLIQHAGRRLTLKQSVEGTFIIGGAWPAGYERGTNKKPTFLDSIVGNVWVAAQIVPALRSALLVRTWAGIGTTNDDDMPVIGESGRVKGFFVLFVGLGFALGPTCGRLLAEQILNGQSSLQLTPYTPDRY